MTGAPSKRARTLAGMGLLLALAAHNLEEAIAYAAMRDRIGETLAQHGLRWWFPAPEQFETALVALTLAAAVAVGWAIRGPSSPGKLALLRGIAVILLVNILAPHVPAAVLLGGYAPGVATALLVNLPVGVATLLALRTSRREA